MTRRSRKGKAKSVLPWQAVVVAVILLGGGVYWLIPDDKDLIQRFLESNQPEKVIEHLEGESGDIRPVEAAAAKIEALSRIADQEKNPALWQSTFETAVNDYVLLGGPEELLNLVIKTTANLEDPASAARWMIQNTGSLDAGVVDPIVEVLVKEVLADDDPSVAAALYREWMVKYNHTSEQIIELVRLRRLAGEEAEALEDLRELKELLEEEDQNDLTVAMEETLLLESLGRVEEAFDLLFGIWEADPSVVSRSNFFQKIRSLSIAADRQKMVVPIMRDRLKMAPKDRDLFSDYLDLNLALSEIEEVQKALEQKRRSGILTPKEARLLAKIREWSGSPQEAFNEYRALALEGDQDALARLFDLNEGLYRHFELADILAKAPGERSAEILLREARLLARIGEYERAIGAYQKLFDSTDSPEASWYAEMADVALTIHEFETALYGLRMAVQLDPAPASEIRWKKDIAWILSLEGEYGLAVSAYASVFLDYDEEDVLPSIISLASILGDERLYRWTLEEIVARNRDSSGEDQAVDKIFRQKDFGADRRWRNALDQYTQSLAQIYADEGRHGEAAEVIRLNSVVYTNGELFGFLLNVLAEAEQFEAAALELEKVEYSFDLLQSIDTIRSAIWILESSERPKEALDLALYALERFPDDEQTKLSVAGLLAGQGRTGEAKEILASIDMEGATPQVLLLASNVAAASGQFAEAESLLLRYLENLKGPKRRRLQGRTLAQIGDLRLAAGDIEGSREFYGEAVDTFRGMGVGELSSSDREDLAYLYARLENPALAEPAAQAIFSENPGNLRILLAMSSLYLAQRNSEQVLSYAKRILAIYPENKDGLFFLAAGYQLIGNPGRSREILMRLKTLYADGARFPFELDLASASFQSGDWLQAITSYKRVLADNQVAPSLRMDVRQALDSLYRRHLPMIQFGFSDVDAGTGSIVEYEGLYSTPLNRRTRLLVEGRSRETKIAATTTTSSDSSSTEIYNATLLYDLAPNYDFRLTGRVFDNDPGAGVAAVREGAEGGLQTLSFDNRVPSTDSLNLRYLFGWEDRLNLLIEQPVIPSVQFRTNLYHRWVYIGDEKFGTGYGADWELTRYERIGSLDFFFSYRGAYSELDIESDNLSLAAGLPYLPGFGPTPDVVDGLSAERIHREGIGVNLIRNFAERWILSANVGIDYYFFLREFAWNAGGGIVYRPLKSVDVSGDVSYSSADNRGNENADNLQILLGVTNRF